MRKHLFFLLFLLPLFLIGQETINFTLPQKGAPDDNRYAGYIEKMQYYMQQRNFNEALFNINKAFTFIDDSTETNPEFIDLAIYRSEMYSWFQQLDKAEMSLLKAIGISGADAEIIVKSTDPENDKALKEVVKKLIKYPGAKTKFGPHIALSMVYNILGDTINLQNEQQLMAERPNMEDWVISTCMALYKIRASKERAHGYVRRIKADVEKEGETKKNQMYLAHYLFETGQFAEAEKIADKYLELDKSALDFLYVKMNIAMALGNVDQMKAYEDRILEINPNAFDK